ncbi:MAG: hypothetical protein NTX97_06335 [Bacteroidetes bacterium]|nr:hypothetical protein [Bacteroidota bacterium]
MKKLLLLLSILFTTSLFAQKKNPDYWQTLDPTKDKVFGVGAEQAIRKI